MSSKTGELCSAPRYLSGYQRSPDLLWFFAPLTKLWFTDDVNGSKPNVQGVVIPG